MLIEIVALWLIHVLVVWIGARHAGRVYGAVFGLLCAMVWLIVVSSRYGLQIGPTTLIVCLTGVILMFSAGIFAGNEHRPGIVRTNTPAESDDGVRMPYREPPRDWLYRVSKLPNEFAAWLEEYRQHIDPWPAFEYYIAAVLSGTVGAIDVSAYRVLDDDLILPMTEVSPQRMNECLRVSNGIAGRVIRTQRSHYCWDEEEPDGTDYSATAPRCAWCFAVVRSGRPLGVVMVGGFSDTEDVDEQLLQMLEGLISEQWVCVTEICRARVASITDASSGMLTRTQFLRAAPMVLEKARRQSRPVTAAAFSVQGLEQLDGAGFWGLHDQAVATVGRLLRTRSTPDDCAGRFNDGRFVMVWPGVGEEQAQQRATRLASELQRLFADVDRWRHPIRINYGVASDGAGQIDLQSMMRRVLTVEEGNGNGHDNGSAPAIPMDHDSIDIVAQTTQACLSPENS